MVGDSGAQKQSRVDPGCCTATPPPAGGSGLTQEAQARGQSLVAQPHLAPEATLSESHRHTGTDPWQQAGAGVGEPPQPGP